MLRAPQKGEAPSKDSGLEAPAAAATLKTQEYNSTYKKKHKDSNHTTPII